MLGALTGTTRRYGTGLYAFTAFLGSGTFEVLRAGVLDVLVQAGAAAGSSSRSGGAGGQIRRRIWLEPGTYTVVVGNGATSPGLHGELSRIEDLVAIGGGGLSGSPAGYGGSCAGSFTNNVPGQGYPSDGGWGAGGAGGPGVGDTGGPGVVWLDGNPYGVGGSKATGGPGAANTGNGGEGNSNANGGSGIVILAQRL